jgi:uncharacterized protein
MLSRLYECRVLHARLHPRAHRFAYRLFFLALDLDELPALARRLRLLRIDRPGLLSFRQSDYLPTHAPLHNPSAPARTASPSPDRLQVSGLSSPPSPASLASPLKSRVLDHLAAHGIAAPADARILLLTLPRVLGYQFNPVSFYFISTPDGTPLAAIAEVTNTFRETKPFVLGPATLRPEPQVSGFSPQPLPSTPLFHLRVPKHFYVSPFSDVDVAFDFRLRPPTERLALQIDDYEGERRTLISTVTNLRAPLPLRDRTLAWFSLKYPLVTLRVIAAIHWQALRLWLKRVPFFAKAARAPDQRDLYHPHPSIAPRPASSPSPLPSLFP